MTDHKRWCPHCNGIQVGKIKETKKCTIRMFS